MFDRIKSFLNQPDTGPGADTLDASKVAAAALLVRAATIDADFAEVDRQTIRRIIETSFEIPPQEVDHLIETAEAQEAETMDLFRWTQAVKEGFSHEERVELIEKLWEVVYADGVVDAFEANLLRRVAGLIYVPDRESGAARRRVMARLGIED